MEDDEFAELLKSLQGGSSTRGSWAEVRAEVQRLGETLGDLTRAAWEQPDNQATVRRLQDALRSLTAEVNRIVEDTPEARRAREQLLLVRDEVRARAERAGEELRPEMLALLRQANGQLRRLGGLEE